MPFLIDYGWLIWKVLLFAFVVASVALTYRRLRWYRVWVVIPVSALLGYGILFTVGGWVMPDDEAPYSDLSTRFVAAAAFPGARDEVLQILDNLEISNDEAGLALRARRLAWRHICPDVAYLAHGQLERARDAARDCGKDVRDYDFALGEFVETAPTLLQLVARGRWSDAATHAKEPCFKHLLAYWSGDASALSRLEHASGARCADLVRVAHDDPYPDGVPTTSLADELGLSDHDYYPDSVRPWTTSDLRRTPDEDIAVGLVLGTVSGGDLSTRAGVDVAIRHGESLNGLDPDVVDPPTALLAQYRIPRIAAMNGNCRFRDAVAVAMAGNGRPLARALRACGVIGLDDRALAIIASRVVEHRDELAVALRFARSFPALRSPFELVAFYAWSRDLAHLTGDEESEIKWQRLVTPFVEVLSDRRRAQALAIAMLDGVEP